jgi:fido (protein-threonine AMPylation protein)
VADWDDDSPRLRRNLEKFRINLRNSAQRRDTPAVESARQWHRDIMAGLGVPKPEFVGRFRGERGAKVPVYIGAAEGVAHADVETQLMDFERRLQQIVAALDRRYPGGAELDEDGVAAVTDLAGWTHAEWVRIHPFANGNGRTARIWANYILVRYGLPPVVRLRPRPNDGYGAAAERAMAGEWEPTARFIRRMLLELPSVG